MKRTRSKNGILMTTTKGADMHPESWPKDVRYSFTIAGALSERSLAAFPELSISEIPGAYTMLYGSIPSASELRGVLARFDVLGLVLIEMSRLPD